MGGMCTCVHLFTNKHNPVSKSAYFILYISYPFFLLLSFLMRLIAHSDCV